MAEDNSTSRHFADSIDPEAAPQRARRKGAHFSGPSDEEVPTPASPVAAVPELEWGANDPFAPKSEEAPAGGEQVDDLPFDGTTSYQPQGTAQTIGHVPVASPSTVPSVDHPGDTLPRNPLLDAQPRLNTDRYAVSTPDSLAVPDAPLTPQQEELGATGSNTPVRIQATKGVESSMDAPRPITVDPSSSATFRTIGADTIGMSTTPEVIVARQGKLPVFGLSIVSDMGNIYGMNHPVTITHEEVIKAVNAVEPKLITLITELIRRSAEIQF